MKLIPAVGSKAQKLPLHRIDLGEICRDDMIAAALAGHISLEKRKPRKQLLNRARFSVSG